MIEQELRRSIAPGSFDRERFAAAAHAHDLLDVAYTTIGSPLGDLLVAATPQGLVRLAFLEIEREDTVLAALAAQVSPRVVRARGPLSEAERQLDGYLAGRVRAFSLPLDRMLFGTFQLRVLEATARVPYGEVTSYGSVAAAIGSPRAARATGNALARNPIPIVVPCHRVVREGGAVGGYAGGSERKRVLLELERN